MYKSKFSIALFLVLILAAGANSAYSQLVGSRAQTLTGIEGIAVSGEDISPVAQEDGLNKSLFVTQTIQELKSAGINVLTDQELNSAPGRPTLVISINTLKHAGGVYSYTVSLSLDQIVTLERNPAIRGAAPTWSVLATGACLPEELNTDVAAYVKRLVQQFIADFKLSNTETSTPSAKETIKKN